MYSDTTFSFALPLFLSVPRCMRFVSLPCQTLIGVKDRTTLPCSKGLISNPRTSFLIRKNERRWAARGLLPPFPVVSEPIFWEGSWNYIFYSQYEASWDIDTASGTVECWDISWGKLLNSPFLTSWLWGIRINDCCLLLTMINLFWIYILGGCKGVLLPKLKEGWQVIVPTVYTPIELVFCSRMHLYITIQALNSKYSWQI